MLGSKHSNNSCTFEIRDSVISDELNHASIIDGADWLEEVKRLVYKHSDMNSLEEKLKEAGENGTKLIVTDGVFLWRT